MSLVKVQGNVSGTGIFTISAPNSNNTRNMTLADTDGTIYIAPGDGIQALASGVPAARTITAGTGVTVTNGNGVAGNPTITNSGVTSAVAGTGISVSGATGAVTIANTGVTSVTAGSNISVSASTGAVTISSTAGAPTTAQVLSATAGASALAVGTYAFLAWGAGATGSNKSAGYTLAGSNLRTTSVFDTGGSLGVSFIDTPSGTWMLVGGMNYNWPNICSVWLRIS